MSASLFGTQWIFVQWKNKTNPIKPTNITKEIIDDVTIWIALLYGIRRIWSLWQNQLSYLIFILRLIMPYWYKDLPQVVWEYFLLVIFVYLVLSRRLLTPYTWCSGSVFRMRPINLFITFQCAHGQGWQILIKLFF